LQRHTVACLVGGRSEQGGSSRWERNRSSTRAGRAAPVARRQSTAARIASRSEHLRSRRVACADRARPGELVEVAVYIRERAPFSCEPGLDSRGERRAGWEGCLSAATLHRRGRRHAHCPGSAPGTTMQRSTARIPRCARRARGRRARAPATCRAARRCSSVSRACARSEQLPPDANIASAGRRFFRVSARAARLLAPPLTIGPTFVSCADATTRLRCGAAHVPVGRATRAFAGGRSSSDQPQLFWAASISDPSTRHSMRSTAPSAAVDLWPLPLERNTAQPRAQVAGAPISITRLLRSPGEWTSRRPGARRRRCPLFEDGRVRVALDRELSRNVFSRHFLCEAIRSRAALRPWAFSPAVRGARIAPTCRRK